MIRFSQSVPNVSPLDVDRVMLRDFDTSARAEASAILAVYGTESWHQAQPRVRMAILKLAQSKLGKLRALVESACADPRNVMALAEFPRYSDTNPSKLSSWWQRFRIFHEDWKEYRQWLVSATPRRE
jgi:hypothetical protein